MGGVSPLHPPAPARNTVQGVPQALGLRFSTPLLKPLWEEVKKGAILGGPREAPQKEGAALGPLLSHPARGWAASQLRGFRDWAESGEVRPPPAAGGAWGEGKGQAPPAHLLTVKCGHLPSRSSAST